MTTPKKTGRPTKYDPKMCQEYVDLAKEGKSKLTICSELGIGFDAFQDYQEKYPAFSEAVKEGQRHSQAWWEEEGRKATFGAKPGFNATSFIFNMANRFKEDWKNKQETEVSGKDGGKIQQDITISWEE